MAATGPKGASHHDARGLRHIDQQGGFEEVTFTSPSFASRGYLCALFDHISDQLFHGMQTPRVGKRTHLYPIVQSVADADGLRGSDEVFDELVVHGLFDN